MRKCLRLIFAEKINDEYNQRQSICLQAYKKLLLTGKLGRMIGDGPELVQVQDRPGDPFSLRLFDIPKGRTGDEILRERSEV